MTGLSSGTHYFAVTAYDTSGNESAFSIEVSSSIFPPATSPDGAITPGGSKQVSTGGAGGCGTILASQGTPPRPGDVSETIVIIAFKHSAYLKNASGYHSSDFHSLKQSNR
jgi:hypothetical protein